jgi:hypothetical protein
LGNKKRNIMKRTLVNLGVAVIFVICPSISRATGPSSLIIRIRPVAVSKTGEVLFKTHIDRNAEGCRGWCTEHTASYGWLVTSSKGIWEEIADSTVVPSEFKDESAAMQRSAILQSEYEAPLDLANPPPPARDLFTKYSFDKGTLVSPDTGKDRVTWLPRQFNADPNRPVTSQRQMTLGRVMSDRGVGKIVKARFSLAGVAVFGNEDSDETSRRQGAKFTFKDIPNMKTYGPDKALHDIGYDLQIVDGICFVDSK